jgi:hypothetical protein
VFGLSLFASKLFFFFTVLVSAKDEYEQYFLLNKKNVECTEKISSVFMLVVLIDEEKIFLTRRFFNVFAGGLVFQRSSDFFRKRLSLCFYLRQVPQEYTPRRFARKQNDCSGVVFLKDLLSVLPGESG